MSTPLTFTVKVSGSGPVTIETDSEKCKTAIELKMLISEKVENLKPDQQKLVFKGKVLNDTDVLSEKKVVNKSIIFLVKGVADKASGSTTPAVTSEKKEEEPAGPPQPCKGGCGFFGNPKTEMYCSKCFKEKTEKEEADNIKKQEEEEKKEKGISSDKKDSSTGTGTDSSVTEKKERKVQEDKMRCWKCNKKVGYAGIECRCGYVFCGLHRMPEEHDCDFDYQNFGKNILEKQNNKVAADKLEDRI